MKTEYFSHDYKARHDDKLIRVFMKHGLAGIGAYWCIIEMLYEQNGYILLCECERIAFELRSNLELINSIINDFNLFKVDKKQFYSISVLNRLKLRNEKSEKAKLSALARWSNANALQTQCEGNANKLNKIKEKKNEIKYPSDFSPFRIEIFEKWFKYKKSKKQSYKDQDSINILFKKLTELTDNELNKAVENSMSNNYDGLFPQKENFAQKENKINYATGSSYEQ
jgi:hypothetical protein